MVHYAVEIANLVWSDRVCIQPRTPIDEICRRCCWTRFGSWCYSGTVQLTPTLALADIPHVIPALRMQQTKLDFMCDVAQVKLTFRHRMHLECRRC